jgi:hypothetical protein
MKRLVSARKCPFAAFVAPAVAPTFGLSRHWRSERQNLPVADAPLAA